MKKRIILGAVLIITISSAYANSVATSKFNLLKISGGNPILPTHNAASLAAFKAMFPGATTIKWSIKGELGHQVEFIYQGVKMKAVFSYTGVYLGA